MTREQAINFLKKGFEEYDIHPSKSFLREAADLLDGIIGWLVFFGRLCIDRNLVNKKEAIKEVIIQGSKLIRSELGELLSRSKRYKHILEAISLGRKRWSEIKSYLISRELQPISDTALYNLLSNLKKMGIIEKKYVDEEIIYEIVDPIIKYTISLGYNN